MARQGIRYDMLTDLIGGAGPLERMAVEHSVGSMGSRCTRMQFPPADVPLLARLDWGRIARRVFIDPVSGVIALMSPSSVHEQYAWGAGLTVIAMSDRLGLQVVTLGATRWRGPDDPQGSGAEPDVCFYLGEKADRRIAARRRGQQALEAFERSTPPDLVIEVERSQGDRDKPAFYRRLGIPEMWRLDIAGDKAEALLLELQAAGGPAVPVSSRVLPAATPALILEALELAVDNRRPELQALIAARMPGRAPGIRP